MVGDSREQPGGRWVLDDDAHFFALAQRERLWLHPAYGETRPAG
jgi:hypothetical protein